MTTTRHMTIAGYAMADRTFERSSTCFSRVVESFNSTRSSEPPTSPAFTIEM